MTTTRQETNQKRPVLDVSIDDVPVAVVDIETTGGFSGAHRLTEVSVVRVEPRLAPKKVLDTLINPRGPIPAKATWIHGITDDDVADAPRFEDMAGHLAKALAGCMIAAYNVCFDL